MPKLKVDGIEAEVPQGATVRQAWEIAGNEIARICYHGRLSILGNCRIFLVERSRQRTSRALPADMSGLYITAVEIDASIGAALPHSAADRRARCP